MSLQRAIPATTTLRYAAGMGVGAVWLIGFLSLPGPSVPLPDTGMPVVAPTATPGGSAGNAQADRGALGTTLGRDTPALYAMAIGPAMERPAPMAVLAPARPPQPEPLSTVPGRAGTLSGLGPAPGAFAPPLRAAVNPFALDAAGRLVTLPRPKPVALAEAAARDRPARHGQPAGAHRRRSAPVPEARTATRTVPAQSSKAPQNTPLAEMQRMLRRLSVAVRREPRPGAGPMRYEPKR